MTKEVLISISGLQFDGQNDMDDIETITRGTYYKHKGWHYVSFDEMMEGFTESTKSTIKFNEKEFHLTKKGLINVHMHFEEKRKSLTDYETPYGPVLIGIDAGKIDVKEGMDKIEVEIDYALEVNYQHLADCLIKMQIQEGQAKDFCLK